MGSYYYINGSKLDIPEDEYIQAILSIAKKHGVAITDEMIAKEVDKQYKVNKKDVWNQARRKKLIKALEGVKGIWANDKDFEKRQKEREKIEIEAVKEMRKTW